MADPVAEVTEELQEEVVLVLVERVMVVAVEEPQVMMNIRLYTRPNLRTNCYYQIHWYLQ